MWKEKYAFLGQRGKKKYLKQKNIIVLEHEVSSVIIMVN